MLEQIVFDMWAFSLDAGAERMADVGDDQYEGVEYDKEPQQKDSDLRLVEGEDEGEGK